VAGVIASRPKARHQPWRYLAYGALATLAHEIASLLAVVFAGGASLILITNSHLGAAHADGLIDGLSLAGFIVVYSITLFLVWQWFSPDAPKRIA